MDLYHPLTHVRNSNRGIVQLSLGWTGWSSQLAYKWIDDGLPPGKSSSISIHSVGSVLGRVDGWCGGKPVTLSVLKATTKLAKSCLIKHFSLHPCMHPDYCFSLACYCSSSSLPYCALFLLGCKPACSAVSRFVLSFSCFQLLAGVNI